MVVQGMENTCLTFVTPVLIAHDRSLTDVCAHEIAYVTRLFYLGISSHRRDNPLQPQLDGQPDRLRKLEPLLVE